MEPPAQSVPGAAAAGPPRRRPVAVTFAAALAMVVGAYHIAHGIAVLVDGGSASKLAEGALDVLLGLLAIAIGVAAIRMRRWSWVAFMTWALVGLVHQLLRRFFYDDPDYLAMALDAFVVIVLTPLDVQIAFGVRPPRNVALEPTSRRPGQLA
jgi:hypothetical protein